MRQYTVSNLLLMMAPLGIVFAGLSFAFRHGNTPSSVLALIGAISFGIPMTVGALVQGRIGLLKGLLMGMVSFAIYDLLVLSNVRG